MRIFLVPSYLTQEELAVLQIMPTATVEAEYGEKVIEGKQVTLAHHAPQYAHCPAPCCSVVQQLQEDAVIVISHIDLDTVGGCLALMGKKPDNKEFWEGAGFIDCNGTHHIYELEESVQEQLNAYYAWNAENRLERFTEIRDVTEQVLQHGKVVRKIVEGDENLLGNGRQWVRAEGEKTERCLIFENERLRVFEIPDNTFCAAAYYSPKYQKTALATVSYNLVKKSITIAFEDGGKVHSAREIVRELWGEEAGGHRGIAGSPRNQEMTEEDFKKAQEKMKKLLGWECK